MLLAFLLVFGLDLLRVLIKHWSILLVIIIVILFLARKIKVLK